RGSAGGPSRLASARGGMQAHAGQQVMDGEVLVLAPHARAPPDRLLAQGPPAPRVVVLEGLAHGEVAGGTDVPPPAAAREEPVRRPAPEAAQRRQRREDRKSTRLNSSHVSISY